MPFTAPVGQVGPGTPVGRLLRRYWQPVLVAHELGAGEARPVRVLGEEPPAPPSYPELDDPAMTVVGGIRPPGTWPCNWFQLVENNADPVHLSFTHLESQPFTREIADFSVEVVDHGLAIVQRRAIGERRTWIHFPQMIHIPMRPPSGEAGEYHFFNWVVPIDDETSMFVATPSAA